jgi:hypothetical protein
VSTVLVCGGRFYANRLLVDQVLSAIRPTRVVVGCAKGADKMAREWAESNGVPFEVYWADWTGRGHPAGPERNQRMLDSERIDLVIAFPGNTGTADMTRRALKAGVPTLQVAEPRK